MKSKSVPQELRDRPQWLNWKEIVRDGRKTKIPVQPSGSPASSTDPKTWCDFDGLSNRYTGAGFVFTADDPYIGIDLDGCRDTKTGKLDAWAKEIVLKFGTYAEVSPSGTGVKLFGVSDVIWKHSNKVNVDGDGHGGKKPGIEIYDCGRFFAVTGLRLQGMHDIVPVEDALEWVAKQYGMVRTETIIDGSDVPPSTPLSERAVKYIAKMDPSISGQRGHDNCFKAACALVLGFNLSTDDAYIILATEFNPRCDPPWSERELRHKVDSAARQPGQRGYLADAQPSDWNKIYVRTGPTPEPEQEEQKTELRVTTLKDAAYKYMATLAEGKATLIDTGIPDLDYAIGGGVAPGEMVIVAARPSHGKSAIALQMVHHITSEDVPAIIISEEMSALALGKRAIQFASDIHEEHWREKDSDVMAQLGHHFDARKPAYIIESCGSVTRVVEEVEKASADHGAGVVVVDYVQLLSAKGKSRYEQVTASSQELRRLASRLGIVVVVLAQLSRQIEERKSFTPQMSDLKETGQLEQDADVIVFGVWPHRINPSNPAREYQFFIGKNRNRPINRPAFVVEFEPRRQRLIEQSVEMADNYDPSFAERS